MNVPSSYSKEVIAVLKAWASFCRQSTGEPDRYLADELEYAWRPDGIRHANGSATGELVAFRTCMVIQKWKIAADGVIVAAPLTLTLWKIINAARSQKHDD